MAAEANFFAERISARETTNGSSNRKSGRDDEPEKGADRTEWRRSLADIDAVQHLGKKPKKAVQKGEKVSGESGRRFKESE